MLHASCFTPPPTYLTGAVGGVAGASADTEGGVAGGSANADGGKAAGKGRGKKGRKGGKKGGKGKVGDNADPGLGKGDVGGDDPNREFGGEAAESAAEEGAQAGADEDAEVLAVTPFESAGTPDEVWCSSCGRYAKHNKSRLMNATHNVWRCNLCGSKAMTLYRICGRACFPWTCPHQTCASVTLRSEKIV